ncbi:hypothetical protein ACJJTC_018827 [Scirpophaga incertulas]
MTKAVSNMVTGMISGINEMGAYGGALTILAYTILLERLKRKCTVQEEELMYNIVITESILCRSILLDSMDMDKGYSKIVKHSSPKILHLLNILKEYNPNTYNNSGVPMKVNVNRKPLSAIIFTKERFTSKVVYNILKEAKDANPEEFGFLNHDFIVGFNVNPLKCTREQHYLKKCYQKALLKFCNKELNCLISTSVIEEGVDIHQCLLVLRYDPPLEYRSYIQSKGRARNATSSFVLMIEEQMRQKFTKQYEGFQDIERYIQKILVGRTSERNAPTLEDIQEGLYDDVEIPPYITEQGNHLSAISAISLLNRYCSTLPHDQFTVITPMWIQETQKIQERSLQIVTIVMPIACPIKEKIQGLPLLSLKSAKRSAALNVCIKLHQSGELDPYTLLPKRYGSVDFEKADIKSCFPNWPDKEDDDDVNCPFKVGTKKMVRKHKLHLPVYLKAEIGESKSWKTNEMKFYLHIIKMKTAFEEPKDSREKALYKLLHKEEGYGILTPLVLPKICDFPMFLTVGEVATSLEVNYAVVPLDLTLFDLIKKFHFFIFNQVLDVAKQFVVFDGEDNNMFVVPTVRSPTGDYDIDWDVMQRYNYIRPVVTPDYEERSSIVVTKEEYQYSVVSPWYRNSIRPDRYIVANVLEYMTPQSSFDTDSFETYENYYANRYNLEIYGNKEQPMLEGRNISSRMNCLMPRAATLKSFSEKQQKAVALAQGDDKPNSFPEYFIPEFCIKYDYPGVLWYKAIMLPSILHRVFMLLNAHELREDIAIATKYGTCRLRDDENWTPITVDIQIATQSLLIQVEEPTQNTAIDRINNPICDSARQHLNIISMKETVYQLQQKKISNEFPWAENMEPVDIERNLSTVTIMDVKCYDEFVSAIISNDDTANAKKTVKSPDNFTTAALMPPPPKFNDKIHLLKRSMSGRGVELRDILAAITTSNSNDTLNLERNETLGDSFLKFASTLYLYHKYPKLNEGQLTNIKGQLIGNRNLYYAGQRVNLGGRMKVEQFKPRHDFLVPGFFAPSEAADFIASKKVSAVLCYFTSIVLYTILTCAQNY